MILSKILEVFTKEYREEAEYEEFMRSKVDCFRLGCGDGSTSKNEKSQLDSLVDLIKNGEIQ
jgi:20S proteasome alpha/beta subunit